MTVPIDLPPQPPRTAIEYRVAAPTRPAGFAQAAVEYARSTRARAQEQAKAEPQPGVGVYRALAAMPDIDEASPHVSRADRAVLRRGPAANAARDPREGYVSMRLRMAAVLDGDSDFGSTAAQERARRCMVVRIVSDPRAGMFVVGGEKAMRDARAALPEGSVEACRETLRTQAAGATFASVAQPRSVAKGRIMADANPAMQLVRSRTQGR